MVSPDNVHAANIEFLMKYVRNVKSENVSYIYYEPTLSLAILDNSYGRGCDCPSILKASCRD